MFTKGHLTLYTETKSYWTVCAFDPAQTIQRSDRYPESQLSYSLQQQHSRLPDSQFLTKFWSFFFFFFLSLEECFIYNCNNVWEITITKAIFIWSGGFFSQHIMVLPGIKTLVKSSLWHISRLKNQIFMHKFGPIVKRQTKPVILAGYNALAICFPSGSHFLQDVN